MWKKKQCMGNKKSLYQNPCGSQIPLLTVILKLNFVRPVCL